MDISRWQAQRRQRISRPNFIPAPEVAAERGSIDIAAASESE